MNPQIKFTQGSGQNCNTQPRPIKPLNTVDGTSASTPFLNLKR